MALYSDKTVAKASRAGRKKAALRGAGTARSCASAEVTAAAAPTAADETLAHLAHELRTPLSAIVSGAELMAEERFGALGDARYKGYALGIASSARHLLEVVELMLSGGPLPVPRRGTDIAAVAAAAIDHVRSLAEENRARIRLIPADGLRAPISATALRQMLINLIANAVNHAGPAPAIVVRSGRDANGAVWIEVEDDGPGIARRIAKRLGVGSNGIQSGARASTRRVSAKGHGFGLAITRAMAEENGAVLVLLPVTPHGTRARLTFSSAAE